MMSSIALIIIDVALMLLALTLAGVAGQFVQDWANEGQPRNSKMLRRANASLLLALVCGAAALAIAGYAS